MEKHAWDFINDEVMESIEEELSKYGVMSDIQRSIANVAMQKMMQFLLDNDFVKGNIKHYKGKED